MYHYLFTNDLRVSELEVKLRETSQYIHDDNIPSAQENKSLNNNINTLMFYFGLIKGGNNIKNCLAGHSRSVVLNFVKRFQFPNPRTIEYYQKSCSDGIRLAPLRCILQVLYAFRMISPEESYLSKDEILNFIFYNSDVAKSESVNPISVVKDILQYRQTGEFPDSVETDPAKRFWKHEDRQIREMLKILEWAGCASINANGNLGIKHINLALEEKASLFDIITSSDIWDGDHGAAFDQIRDSYYSYFEMDEVARLNKSGEAQSSLCVDQEQILDAALRLFKKRRMSEWLAHGLVVNAKIREYFDQLTEPDLAAYDADKIKKFFCGFTDTDGKHFEAMWAGKVHAGWGQLEPSNDGEVHALAEYLAKLKHDTSVATLFFQPGFVRPKGCGLAVTSELLMKFHPESCFKTGGVTRESMKLLDLLDFTNLKADSETEYKLICGTATSLLVKMKAMSIARSVKEDGTGDGQPADYLTVNEFLWFVKDQFKEIQNEVMNMSLETPTDETNPGNKEWKDILSDNPDDMMNRLVAALLTKPFAILAGASGTGKSRMVRKLAYMTCLNKQLQPDPATKKPIENFRMVQVKPNWHDSTELLGYRSSVSGGHEYVSTDFVRFVLKAHAFPNTPFFVCLDEMNLAPVEHYFAEFLSASESARVENGEYITDPIVDPGEFGGDIANLDPQGYSIPDARKALIEKRGLYLPRNLFVVGTVNMDDTTGGFSRKVLDRAMTIEMNEVNFDELQKPVELRLEDKQEADGTVSEKGLLLKAEQIKVFIDRVEFKPESFDNGLKNQLEDVRVKLATTPLAFAFRFARECVQYRDALKLLFPDDPTAGKTYDHTGFALDHMFLMKILPRLVGNLDERQGVVDKLNVFFGTLANHSVSADKLKFMLDASETNGGFLSYYM